MFRVRNSFSLSCLFYGVIFLGLLGSASCRSSKVNKRRSVTPCKATTDFRCRFSEVCIGGDLRCNGHSDCDDGSDETDCVDVDNKSNSTVTIDDCLESHMFKCKNTKCISAKWLCDGIIQCGLNDDGDMSDEKDCDVTTLSPREKRPALNHTFTVPCDPEVHWRCLTGQCIFKDWLCDGQPDCTDLSDEPAGCSLVHECPGEFKCTSGECIRRNWRCDEKRDCDDGSDEDGCTAVIDCPKENGKFLCKSGECINSTLVCNKKNDCKDGSDEFTGCESSCNKTSCAQGCIPNFNVTQPGFCYCNEGYSISGKDKNNCADIDECAIFGTCSQFCENTKGSYLCRCLDGFKLDSNNTNICVPEEGDDIMLIFGMKNSIRKYSILGKKYSSIVDKSGTPVGIAYDSQNGYVYWTDVMDYQEAIVRSKLDGSGVETVVDTGLMLPEGIAFDWIAGNIYFTDSNNSHIGVCTSDGTKCTVVVHEMDKPRDIAVDPNLGYMFWTDWGKVAAIVRAGLDGSTPLPIVSTDLKWPNGLAIDHGTSRIYWNDANSDKIETTNFQGEDRQVVRSVGLRHPFGLEVFADLIIWSDWTVGEIQAANKFNGKDHTVLVKEPIDLLNGLVIAHPANQPKLRANHCLNAKCSHICTLTPTKSFRCLCPIGMKLDKDRRNCNDDPLKAKLLIAHDNLLKTFRFDSIGRKLLDQFALESVKNIGCAIYNPLNDTVILSDTYTKAIYEYKMRTKQLTMLVQKHIDTVKGMDIDIIGQNLYWVDTKRRTVEVMSLKTKARFVIFRENDRPVDLVIVPEIKLMFIAQVSQRGGKIVKMSLNGSNRSVVIRIPNGEPTAITYHRESGHIFWLDSVQNTIEHASVNGRNYYGPISTPGSPYSLAAFGDKIYWSDRYTQLLMSSSVSSNRISSPIFIGDQDVPNVNAKDSYMQGNFFARISVMSNDTSYAKELVNRHECSKSNSCSHICLISSEDLVGTCVCPDGLQLGPDKKTCVEQIGCDLTQFACKNGHCISEDWKCDGTPDCLEGEDEKDCVAVKSCRKSDFVCETDKVCVPGHWKCDGENDCHDGSDERNCTMKPCAIDTDFRCESGRCVPSSWRCDGMVDCPDSSDEKNCSAPCSPGYIQCNGTHGSRCILKDENCEIGIVLYDGRMENSLGIKDDALRESSSSTSKGTTAGIVVGVLLLVVAVLAIIVFVLDRRSGHPKIVVRPYVRQWVKYVNQPVQRYFGSNARPEPLNGEKHLYDEVYHAGGGSTYANPGYEEIDAPNNMYTALDDMPKAQARSFTDSGILHSERNSLYEEEADSHCIAFNQKDRLINY